jgi:hypothetical protein
MGFFVIVGGVALLFQYSLELLRREREEKMQSKKKAEEAEEEEEGEGEGEDGDGSGGRGRDGENAAGEREEESESGIFGALVGGAGLRVKEDNNHLGENEGVGLRNRNRGGSGVSGIKKKKGSKTSEKEDVDAIEPEFVVVVEGSGKSVKEGKGRTDGSDPFMVSNQTLNQSVESVRNSTEEGVLDSRTSTGRRRRRWRSLESPFGNESRGIGDANEEDDEEEEEDNNRGGLTNGDGSAGLSSMGSPTSAQSSAPIFRMAGGDSHHLYETCTMGHVVSLTAPRLSSEDAGNGSLGVGGGIPLLDGYLPLNRGS